MPMLPSLIPLLLKSGSNGHRDRQNITHGDREKAGLPLLLCSHPPTSTAVYFQHLVYTSGLKLN